MTTYTHHLILARAMKITPILLVPIEVSLHDLVERTRQEIERRALLLRHDTSEVSKLERFTSAYFRERASSLFRRDVRLGRTNRDISDEEDGIVWTLFGGRFMPPDWQGPADGVIPKETPVTIWAKDAVESHFQIIEP